MEVKKQAKTLMKKMGKKFRPGEMDEGSFLMLINGIKKEELREFIIKQQKKYYKQFVRYYTGKKTPQPIAQVTPKSLKKANNNSKDLSTQEVENEHSGPVKMSKKKKKPSKKKKGRARNGHPETNGVVSSVKVSVEGDDQDSFHKLLLKQNVTGENLLKLMENLLTLLTDNLERDMTEIKHNLMLCHMKKTSVDKFPAVGNKYFDLMAALLSIYIDEVALKSRNNEHKHKMGKRLTAFVSYLLADSPLMMIDCLLQTEHLLPEDAVLVTPLFRKTFEYLKEDTELSLELYAKALCLKFEASKIGLLDAHLKNGFSSLSVPQEFRQWLTDHGIKDTYCGTTNNPAFFESVMEALTSCTENNASQAPDECSSEDKEDNTIQTEPDLFFIDTGADIATKEMFPEVEEDDLESDAVDDDIGESGSNIDEPNDEGYCGTVVADTLKSIRALTEKELVSENKDEGQNIRGEQVVRVDSSEDSDIEVYEIRNPSTKSSTLKEKHMETGLQGTHVEPSQNSDILPVQGKSPTKGKNLKEQEDFKQMRATSADFFNDSDINELEVSSPSQKRSEKMSSTKAKKTRSSKRGKGVLSGHKSDDEHGSVILMNLVDMFSAEESDEMVKDTLDGDMTTNELLPLDMEVETATTPVTSKRMLKNTPKGTGNRGSAVKSGMAKGGLNLSGEDGIVLSPRKSHRKTSALPEMSESENISVSKLQLEASQVLDAELSQMKKSRRKSKLASPIKGAIDSLKKLSASPKIDGSKDQMVLSPSKRQREQTKLASPKKVVAESLVSVTAVDVNPEKSRPFEKLQQKRVAELKSSPRARTRSHDADTAKPATPMESPGTTRRRTRSEALHESQSSPCKSKSPMKVINPENDCEVSRLRLHFPENVVIEEVGPPLNDGEAIDKQWIDIVAKRAKKTPTKATTKHTEEDPILSPFEFHGTSSEEEDEIPVNSPKSLTRIKSKSPAVGDVNKSLSKGEQSLNVTPSKTDRSQRKARKSKSSEELTPACVACSPFKTKTPKSSSRSKAKGSINDQDDRQGVTVPSTPKSGKPSAPDTPKSVRGGAAKELAALKQCAMTDFFTASPLSPEETRRRYSLRHKAMDDDPKSSIFMKTTPLNSDASDAVAAVFGTPQAAVAYSGKKRRRSEIPRSSSELSQVTSSAIKRRLSTIKHQDSPSKSAHYLRH